MTIEYNFETTINGKLIQCRAFTLEEYLSLVRAKANKTLTTEVLKVIKSCTDAKDLNKQESELLIIRLWAHSIGEVNHTATYVCSCGHEIQTPLNTTHAQIPPPGDLLYHLNGFKIKFKYPKLFDDSDISLMIASCIEYLVVGGEQIFFDDLSDVEIQDLYSAITTEDISKIKDLLLAPKVELAVPIKCEKCGENHVQKITGLKEFFRILQ